MFFIVLKVLMATVLATGICLLLEGFFGISKNPYQFYSMAIAIAVIVGLAF